MSTNEQYIKFKSLLNLQFHDDNKQHIKKPDELEIDPPSINNNQLLDRIQGSMIAMAIGDALGAHVEFRPHSYLEENPVKDLQGGGTWGLEKGQFTDDTSMALCLANSLIVCQDFVPYDQLVRYKWWYRNGYMSSTGHCFDIGAATRQSIQEFEERQRKFAEEYGISFDDMDSPSNPDLFEEFDVNCSKDGVAGNGALMRLTPVPLFFYRNPIKAVDYSGISGRITHGDRKAYDACRYYGALIVATLHGANKADLTSNTFYEDNKQWFGDDDLHSDIKNIAQGSYKKEGGYKDGIRGKGYIVNALEAALWAFWSDGDSFEKGVLSAVNLGDDTDTTAAIYGQLAGAYYGYNKLPSKWREVIYAKDFVLCVSNWIAYEGEQWFNRQNVPPSPSFSPEPLINSNPMNKNLNTTISFNQKSYSSNKYQPSLTHSMGQNTIAIIGRKAIDPSGRIGSFYNAYRDCLVEELYVNLGLNKNRVCSFPKCRIERGEKIESQNLLQFMGFDDELRLSLASNIVNPTGIASVIKYPYLIDECTRVFYYSHIIRQEYFSNDINKIKEHIEQSTYKSNATHIITAIDIGIDIIIIIRLTSDHSNIIDDTLNKIEQSLINDTILSDKISIDGIVSIHIYSNINHLNKQTTLNDIYQLICQMKKNIDNYQPINYILHPIQTFITDNNKFIPLKQTIVQKIEQDLFQFSWINKIWLRTQDDDKYNILKEYFKEQLDDIEKQLFKLNQQYTNEKKRFQQLILTIRYGKDSQNKIEHQILDDNHQIIFKNNIDEFIYSITTLKEKGFFIKDLKDRNFEYENANKYNIDQNDDENTIQQKLIGNNENFYFICSNDTLNNNNLSRLEQLCLQLSKEKKLNENLKLIYLDFSYSSYELDQIKIFPLIKSIKDQNTQISLLLTKRKIFNNPLSIDDKTFNILLLGKSGVGKSTLINNLITYLKYNREENVPSILSSTFSFISFSHPILIGIEEHLIQFGIRDLNENCDHPDQSTTQQCKLYHFKLNNNFKLCIIDTPGFSKIDNNNNDDINMQHILSRIINLTHLNAICIIIESGDNKLDNYHNCLTDLFDFLGDNVINNIIFCFTKLYSKELSYDQKTHYVKLLVDSFSPRKIPFNENNIFDFDSTFFIDSTISNRFSLFINPPNQTSQLSWKTSKNGWNRLINYIRQNIHPYSIQQGLQKIQSARLEINQLIRPLLETIRNYFRNFILSKTTDYNSSIELIPIPLLYPSAICCSCKRHYYECAGFWIISDSPHEYRNTCYKCSCIPQQHIRIQYKLQHKYSNNQSQLNFFDRQDLLCTTVHLAYFLLEGHYNANDDLFLLYLNRMIEEERSICGSLGSHRLNLALYNQLINFRHNYQQRINIIKQTHIQNNFDIDDVIQNVKQIPMVKIQLDVATKMQETSL